MTIDNEIIKEGDWIIAYNEDIVVGAREWIGPYTDIPTMGDDGSELTSGFMKTGLKPQFKILRNGKLIELEKNVPAWSSNTIYQVQSLSALPESFSLVAAYPNPFNPATLIHYILAAPGAVELAIYNVLGHKVRTLVDTYQEAGRYSVEWDGTNYPSGIYIAQISNGNYFKTVKMLLVK